MKYPDYLRGGEVGVPFIEFKIRRSLAVKGQSLDGSLFHWTDLSYMVISLLLMFLIIMHLILIIHMFNYTQVQDDK